MPYDMCAMKLIDGMGGNPCWPYQEVGKPLGLSRIGRSMPVSSMPLKGTREARGNAAKMRGLAERSYGECT
jgi:hypothetical protein